MHRRRLNGAVAEAEAGALLAKYSTYTLVGCIFEQQPASQPLDSICDCKCNFDFALEASLFGKATSSSCGSSSKGEQQRSANIEIY